MNQYLFASMLFLMPWLLFKLPEVNKGFTSGLMLALLFLTKDNLLLSLVPFLASIYIFIATASHKSVLTGIKNDIMLHNIQFKGRRSHFLLYLCFLFSLTIFLGIGSVKTNAISSDFTYLAAPFGSVFFGVLSDKRGPFSSSIYLSLICELSVCFLSISLENHSVVSLANLLLAFSIGGAFIILPLMTYAYLGNFAFATKYVPLCLLLFVIWTLINFSVNDNSSSYFSTDYLTLLLILSISSAIFLKISWKNRLYVISS